MKSHLKINLILLVIFIFLIMLSTMSTVEGESKITSEKYVISELYNYLLRVEPKTTVDKFKENLVSDDATNIHVYLDQTCEDEITTGNIGTGMVVRYEEPEKLELEEPQMYIISVIGDIDKDGFIQDIELNNAIRYVVDKQNNDFDRLSFLSLDIFKVTLLL